MSGGVMSLSDFMRLYQPTVLPQASSPQPSGLAALGQSQPAGQRSSDLGFGQSQGQGQSQGTGQGQQGGVLPFLGQVSRLGGAAPAGTVAPGVLGQAQPAQGGLQQLLIGAMQNNGANGNSNALANAVGYVPFGTGSFG